MSDEPKVESAAVSVSSNSVPARTDGVATEVKDSETGVNSNGLGASETVMEAPATGSKST